MIRALFLATISFGTLSLVAMGTPPALAENAAGSVSVIELFTSQGCSSCPPADRLIQQLAKRQDIIALSFPVTYWDYLGWKDTLAKPENTQRQRGYAAARGDGQIYTPQAVVNGLEDCVGSNLDAIESAVKASSRALSSEAVPIKVRRGDGRLLVEVGRAPDGARHRTGKVWVATVARSATIDIGRGENAGRQVTYTNVVEKLTDAGEWQGEATSYSVPLGAISKNGDMLVVFLQADGLGPIVGAARLDG